MKEEYLAGQLIAMHQVLALLLARESVHSGTDVRVMQEPLIQTTSDAVAKLGGPASLPSDSLAAVEASTSKCLDEIYRLAAGLRSHMHGPNDPPAD